MLTQEELRKELLYVPATGGFYRKGNLVGNRHHSGYMRIMVLGKRYQSHRLAWLYIHGEWPNEIDHINHIKDDNRISNLRNVTRKENLKNISISSRNKSGVVGVSWHRGSRKWQADIKVDKKTVYLGIFQDKFEAICARLSANTKYGFHENHGKLNGLDFDWIEVDGVRQ